MKGSHPVWTRPSAIINFKEDVIGCFWKISMAIIITRGWVIHNDSIPLKIL